MTINQLLRESYSLGFDDSGELCDAFIFAANRAKRIIYSEIAPEKRASFILNSPKVSYRMESYRHTPGNSFTLSIKGMAFSFKYSGTGTLTIIEKNLRKTKNFNKQNGTMKEFFNGECELKFSGALTYSVFDLTVYDSKFSANAEDIPIYSALKEISLCDYISDFGIVTRLPEDRNGESVTDASVSGDVMRLPFEFEGEVSVYYKPCAELLSQNNPDSDVGIPKRAEHLLPILTASYLWLDDDPEKAEYYASIYRSEMNRILMTEPRSIGATYRDVLGWA